MAETAPDLKVINRNSPLDIATLVALVSPTTFGVLRADGSMHSVDRRGWLPIGGVWPDGQIDDGDIRAHPNGFIQIDLDDNDKRRLHVWDDRLPRQKVPSPIHDHRFDFVSTVLKGRLANFIYELDETAEPTHQRWRAVRSSDSQETVLEPFFAPVAACAVDVRVIEAGQRYEFLAGKFHETRYDTPTVTLMEKQNTYPDYESSALVPVGLEPDNDYSRFACSREFMWSVIEGALR